MRASDILLLLGFGLHLTVVLVLITATTEVDAIFKDVLEIVHHSSLFTLHYSLFTLHFPLLNGGKV